MKTFAIGLIVFAASVPAASRMMQTAAPAWQDTIRNLRHPDPKIRLQAVAALEKARFAPAAEAMAPLVADPDNRVQIAAIGAELTFFLHDQIGNRKSKNRSLNAFNAGPLVRAAGAAPPALIDALIVAIRDEDSRVRFDAVHSLGVIAEPPLSPAQVRGLIDQLDHYEPVIRAATERVMARLRLKEAGEKLINGMNDSSQMVRDFAIDALGRVREPLAVASLLQFHAHYKTGAKAAAPFLAVARIGEPSTRDVLRGRLGDKDAAIRRAAAEGLGRLNDQESLPALKQMMTTDKAAPVRLAAMFAVNALGDTQTHLLAMAALTRDTGWQAIEYLLEIGQAAVPGIKSALGVVVKPVEKKVLIRILGFVGERDAVQLIEPYLQDKDQRVKLASADSLARLMR